MEEMRGRLFQACEGIVSCQGQVGALEEVFGEGSPKQPVDCTLEELNSLELKMEEKKLHWMDARSALPAQAPDDFSQQMAKVKADKKACEDDLKGLNKAICPHKMWAKNAGLI